MIDVKELRINNYVLCKNEVCRVNMINRGDIVEVSTIDSDSVKECFIEEVLSDRIYPIPLTKELFLMCGFIIRDDCFEDCKNGIYFNIGNQYFEFDRDSGGYFYCQYLHQLQNIYFALTGKELEVAI